MTVSALARKVASTAPPRPTLSGASRMDRRAASVSAVTVSAVAPAVSTGSAAGLAGSGGVSVGASSVADGAEAGDGGCLGWRQCGVDRLDRGVGGFPAESAGVAAASGGSALGLAGSTGVSVDAATVSAGAEAATAVSPALSVDANAVPIGSTAVSAGSPAESASAAAASAGRPPGMGGGSEGPCTCAADRANSNATAISSTLCAPSRVSDRGNRNQARAASCNATGTKKAIA